MFNKRILDQLSELEALAAGLKNCDTILLKEKKDSLECQFLLGGLVKAAVQVNCGTLAAAIRQEAVKGIIVGAGLVAFKNNFDSIALRVKAKTLYSELKSQQKDDSLDRPNMSVA